MPVSGEMADRGERGGSRSDRRQRDVTRGARGSFRGAQDVGFDPATGEFTGAGPSDNGRAAAGSFRAAQDVGLNPATGMPYTHRERKAMARERDALADAVAEGRDPREAIAEAQIANQLSPAQRVGNALLNLGTGKMLGARLQPVMGPEGEPMLQRRFAPGQMAATMATGPIAGLATTFGASPVTAAEIAQAGKAGLMATGEFDVGAPISLAEALAMGESDAATTGRGKDSDDRGGGAATKPGAAAARATPLPSPGVDSLDLVMAMLGAPRRQAVRVI